MMLALPSPSCDKQKYPQRFYKSSGDINLPSLLCHSSGDHLASLNQEVYYIRLWPPYIKFRMAFNNSLVVTSKFFFMLKLDIFLKMYTVPVILSFYLFLYCLKNQSIIFTLVSISKLIVNTPSNYLVSLIEPSRVSSSGQTFLEYS